MTNFYKCGLFPVVIFDGKADELKRIVTRDEGHDFRILEMWYRKAIKDNDKDTAKSIAYDRLFLWKNAVKEAKSMLISMGIPIITAPGEAEAQCASLVARNIVDYASSNDYDTLLFGCPHLLRGLVFSGRSMVNGKWKSEKASAHRIELKHILEKNRIDLMQLVDISLLIGNDFFKGIDGIGPKTALELVHKYGDIFGALGHLKMYDKVDQKRLSKARDLLLFPVVYDRIPEFEWRFPNSGGLISQMCNDHRLNREKSENAINNLIKEYKMLKKNAKN
jgi:flap endonuclease-1